MTFAAGSETWFSSNGALKVNVQEREEVRGGGLRDGES